MFLKITQAIQERVAVIQPARAGCMYNGIDASIVKQCQALYIS